MAEQVRMVFQPIFDKTMQVFAYEGLMRFADTTIVKVIDDCKSYSDFYEIEKLTFFKALQEYQKRNYKEKLFINSFPHVHLSKTDLSDCFMKGFGFLQFPLCPFRILDHSFLLTPLLVLKFVFPALLPVLYWFLALLRYSFLLLFLHLL